MKKFVVILLAAAFVTMGLVWAEDAAAPKVDPKVETLVAKLKADVEAAKAKIKDGATDDEKKTAEERHGKMQKLVTEKLLALCTNPVFVKEVAAQNDKKTSLDDIKKTDDEWQKAESELPIQKEKLNNDCAKEIIRLAKELKVIGETFVMDNQGANVGQNALTSDYWQGDEPKWQKPFAEGKGGVDIAEPKFDKSANTVEQKVSLPIIDAAGNVIGAVCWGVRVDQL
jgi:hypothetical protein